ncbi:MAG: type IV toxin-antitoxin system AbiEi family antitoxin domain-containing protein [Candidatus Zixiibacteriota bacterium]
MESQKKNPKSKEKDLLEFVKRRGLVRVKDVIDAGYYSQTLRRLHQKELLIRVSRGLYSHPDMIPGEHQSLVEVAKRVPRAIVCLLTALRYHNIGTQNPKDVWIALPPNLRKPKMQYPPTRVVRFSGDALTEGVEHHMLRGVEVKIYNPAKTVADCFKHRKKIGLDVAMEALKDVIQRRKCTVDDIWYYAKIDRVTKVIEPYMTAMLA